jgi:hypothetical protein
MTEAITLRTHGLTINDLMEAWQLDRKQVQLIRKIIYDPELDLNQFKSVQQRHSECYHPPDRIDCQLTAINELIDGFGVESIEVSSDLFQDRYYWNSIGLYVNQGDTYALTVIYNTVDRLFEFTNWGDYFESMEYRLQLDNTDY